jgi:hypothetical protein
VESKLVGSATKDVCQERFVAKKWGALRLPRVLERLPVLEAVLQDQLHGARLVREDLVRLVEG